MEIKRHGLFSYHPLTDKERKNLTILELVRKKGPISRTEISKITDINIVSISNYIKNYIEKKLVTEKGFDVSSGGRRPELVEFNAAGGYVIGIDVNSSEYIAAMTDLALKTVMKMKAPRPLLPATPAHHYERAEARVDIDEVTLKATDLIKELIKKSGIETSAIKMIGIGISGAGLSGLREKIEKNIGIETLMASDAACAAFGEKKLNPEADVEDLLYMYSDIGCGIVIRGDIYFGAGGNAGDMKVFNETISREEHDMFSRDSQYLRPWCVDLGIIQAARKEIEKGIGTKMVALAGGSIENLTKQVVIEAARQDDEVALDIIKNVGINLGIRTAYLVNLFDPEVVVVGGCVEKAGNLILDPIKNAIKKFALNKQAQAVRIIPSKLEEDGVSLGAASLSTRELFLRA